MSDENQTSSTPAPAPSAPTDRIHVGNSYHEFQQQVNERVKAQQKPAQGLNQPAPSQPPPAAKTVQPTPKQPLEQIQANAAAEAAKLNAPAEGTEGAPAEEQQGQTDEQGQQQGISAEDMELLAKAKRWLESEEMPEEFHDKLVRLKNGEEFEHEPYSEAVQRMMRERDHSRAMQAIKREREQWADRERHFTSHFDAIFNDENNGAAGGEAMYEIYSRAGKFKQLEHLYSRMDRERQEDVDAANGLGLAVMRRLTLDPKNPQHVKDSRVQDAIRKEFAKRRSQREQDAHHRAIKLENERLKAGQQHKQREDQLQEHYATQKKQLEQLRPRAFQNMGLNHEDPVHRQEFDTYLNALIQQDNVTRVTPELVSRAARGAKEAIRDREKRLAGGAGGAPGQVQQKTFSPQLSGGGKMPGGSKPKQWHADSFAEAHNLPKWGGGR